MNRYGRMALDRCQTHRPVTCSLIQDPDRFFSQIGETIAVEVTHLRDRLLGEPTPGEDLEAFRRRAYLALAMAEEQVLANHHLFQADPADPWELEEPDDELTERLHLLQQLNRSINQPL